MANLLSKLKPKRRWVQFSMRTVLVLTTACGILLGWRANDVRRERDALALVESLGGYATFDYQCDFDKDELRVVDPGREAPRNSWLMSMVGEEYFRHIACIFFRDTSVTDKDLKRITGLAGLVSLDLPECKVTVAELTSLARMRQLQMLNLSDTQVTNAGLVHLKGLRRLHGLSLIRTRISSEGLVHLQGLSGLHTLRLDNTQVTDSGLANLQGLTRLRGLTLANTQVTDAGLALLQGLTSLRGLDLTNTKVTDAGIAKLRQALPKCQITGP
jgi:hypothetical protein